MKIAVMAGFFTEGDMQVNSGHAGCNNVLAKVNAIMIPGQFLTVKFEKSIFAGCYKKGSASDGFKILIR